MINLIPMAGRGNRFLEEMYHVPKPFMPVLGRPMFLAALESFPAADKNIFICRRGMEKRLERAIQSCLPQSDIIALDEITQGQACTCLLAEKLWHKDQGLFIASCDYWTVYDHDKYRKLIEDECIDVVIWTFKIGAIKKADPSAFAYCRTEGSRVVEVVEKKTISGAPHQDHAVVGSFTYKRAEYFSRGAKKMIAKNIRVNNEFYVATSINQLIQEGVRVAVFEVDKFISFGNPFELSMFHYWQEYFDCLEDHPYSIQCGFKKRRQRVCASEM